MDTDRKLRRLAWEYAIGKHVTPRVARFDHMERVLYRCAERRLLTVGDVKRYIASGTRQHNLHKLFDTNSKAMIDLIIKMRLGVDA